MLTEAEWIEKFRDARAGSYDEDVAQVLASHDHAQRAEIERQRARAGRYLAAIREWVEATADMNPETMSTERCYSAEAALRAIVEEPRRG